MGKVSVAWIAEAIAGKLMWILGQTRAPETIHRLFYTPVANDILNYHT